MSLYAKLRGTIETIFQIGLGGPQLKNNSGTIEARNSTDAAFVKIRALEPSSNGSASDNEVVTQQAAQRNFHRSFLLMGG